jgi:hypothetical protein
MTYVFPGQTFLPALSPPLPDLMPLSSKQPPSMPAEDVGQGPDIMTAPFPPIQIHSVRAGCWLLSYTPTGAGLVTYDGTLRVESHSGGRTASGDLYQRRFIHLQHPSLPPVPVLLPGPNPAGGIPVMARGRYRYYLRVTEILEFFTFGNSFKFGFEMWRFTSPNSWSNEGAFSAQMTWMAAPAGYPSAKDYLEGDVKNAAGAVIGRLKMGWLSSYYRKATVEIDTVSGSEQPLDNGAGVTWKSVFDTVGWDVTIKPSDTNVAEASGAGWSDPEMHAAMLARRDAANLDSEWRYHVLAVKLIDSTPRGIMYDAGGTDSNAVPREGVGISSHWVIPDTPEWGLVRNMRFGTAKAPYFRTAVHELGHAFGLFHNTVDLGFMNTTDVIAAAATAATPFPTNIKWNYAADDLKRLRHYPDVFVRPGGTAFGTASTVTPPISPTDLQVDMPGLELRVSALLGEVPIGAPVRVTLELLNNGDMPQRVPEKLSLKTDFVRGSVRDPGGMVRSFSPVVRCIEEEPMRILNKGESISESLTLMRGYEGALFPMPGVHEVVAEVRWDAGGLEACVMGRTTVMVTGARDAEHARAAHHVLSTPDAHMVLVVGGDHLTEGVAAMQAALDNAVLRPHFASIEAKRLMLRQGRRKPDPKTAAALIDDAAVMSGSEAGKLAKLAKQSGSRSEGGMIGAALKRKATRLDMAPAAKAAIDAL